MNAQRPKRKALPHEIPSWVEDGSVYFITVCTAPRGTNQLAHVRVAARIQESMQYYQNRNLWWLHLLMVMPDHIHALMSFSHDPGMKKSLSDWKHYVARALAIHWQRDFFDHRLRNDESFDEKAYYIRMNPVRAGLVAQAEDWPYVW